MKVSRKLRALLLFSCLAALGGCTPDSGPSSEEPLGEAVQAVTTTTLSAYTNPSTNTVLSSTGGKKLVWTTSGLHSVWARGGTVYYATSPDGVAWSAPLALDTSAAFAPSIASADNGTVGVVYIRRNAGGNGYNHVYYRSRGPAGSWGAAFKVTSDYTSEFGTDTSITTLGDIVHLAWSSTSYVFHASFPLTQTTSIPTAYVVNLSSMCSIYTLSNPSIAVSNGTFGNPPIIRVAWYQYRRPYSPTCTPDDSFGWLVAEKPANANDYWPVVVSGYGGPVSPSGTGAVSLSLTANKSTADFYLATSDLVNGVGSTRLWYENAWSTTDTWRSVSILPRAALIDVAAEFMNCGPQLRIAVSDYTQGSNGYGPTFTQTGTWEGAATTPTWLTSSTPTASQGRVGSALLWEKTLTSTTVRDVYSLFETWAGASNYTLVDAYDTKPTPSCGPPSCTACHPSEFTRSGLMNQGTCARGQRLGARP
ncbi:hypothetical protein [Pyxidicoccus trucidator]|uniref:hypothetical protein n=1 Tax=Pyxidicoccus trucidator TaxID=2709662 RepID=UPI0013DB846F|nr:hypothetical protein [Pyxidicoccus trucidator]